MTSRTRLVVLFATVPFITFTLVGGFLGRVVARENTYRHLRIFEDVVSLISNNYVEPVEFDGVMKGALRGLAEGLDADSAYLLEEDVEWINGEHLVPSVGIGVEVTRQFYVQIVAPRDGSPAARAGLLPGDFIRTIDNQSTRLMSAIEGARRLRGEPGSTVHLSLLRGNTSEPFEIDLVRERPEGDSVDYKLLPTGEGYIRMASFAEGATEDLKRAVTVLLSERAPGLVVDVRNAAGGSYEEGIAAARLFVASGTILRRIEYGHWDDKAFRIDATAGDKAIDSPMILLSNFGTANAAELFTAALVENNRAETVGGRTAGRASLQKLVRLPDATGLWLSWARYLKGSGEPLHRYGVEPTVAVAVRLVELGEPLPDGDKVLEQALERLRMTS